MAEYVCVRADQCHVLPPGLDDGLGAMMEPLAVALHAVKRAGTVSGRSVLVTGGGTIGLLVAMTARAFGATPVVVTDVVESRRAKALALGADAALDPSAPELREQVRALASEGFDVILEASGARPALRQAFDLVRPGGTLVQIGTLGTEDVPLPANQIMVREINFVGSMRYGNVFDEAIRLVASGRIDLRPFISDVLPIADCRRAMELAADKASALKVQLQLGPSP
jgi:L-idonate 5-dehydrogenase